MINVNLLPEEFRQEIDQAKKNSEIVSIFKKSLLVFVIALVAILGVFYYYKITNDFYNNNLKQKESEIKKYGNLQENSQKISERINTIGQIDRNSNKWTELMNEINNIIPNGIYLAGITIDSNKKIRTQITGFALSKAEVAALQRALEQSKMFEFVDIESSQIQKDPATGTDKERFIISLTLSKEALK